MRKLEHQVHKPGEIYRALRVVYARNWIVPAILIALVAWAIAFLLFGRIPITGTGNAMFLTRGTVVPVQSTATGQIGRWLIAVGDVVEKDQLLAEVEQPLLQKQLEQARQQLEDAREKNTVIARLTATYSELEVQAVERKRTSLLDRIEVLENELRTSLKLAAENREESVRVLAKQDENLSSLRELEQQRLDELVAKLQRTEDLRQQGLRSEDDILAVRQTINDQRVRVADLGVEAVKLQLEKVQADEAHLQTLNRIAERENEILDLRQELVSLDSQLALILKTDAEAKSVRELEESELQRNIDRIARELEENGELRAEHGGRVLELTVGQWEYISRGQLLGSIDTRDEHSQLEAVAYFKLKDGKRIKQGMRLRLTPATVQRERYGSVIAEVTSTSDYAVSPEGAAKVVGNSSVAAELTANGHQLEVFARLLGGGRSETGYLWDISQGPEVEVAFGTRAAALVNLEERPPISFIIPILRNWKPFARVGGAP